MNRLKGIALAIVLAVFLLAPVLPAGAETWGNSRSNSYWMEHNAQDLLSNEFLRTLRLSTRQTEAMRELWGEQLDERRVDRLGNLQQTVNLLAVGGLVTEDRRRAMDGDISYLLSGDDAFLRRYYDILNPQQHQIVRNYLARGNTNWNGVGWQFGKVRWEMSRELERDLHLTQSQKRQIDRILRDASADQRQREKRIRTQEREYYLNNWDNFSGRKDTSFRRQLKETRRNSWLITSNTRDKIYSILSIRQRSTFDSAQAGMFEPYSSDQKQSDKKLKESNKNPKESDKKLKKTN